MSVNVEFSDWCKNLIASRSLKSIAKFFSNEKIILGVSRTHDVSAAIFKGDALIGFAEAERFLNIKHARWKDKLEPTIIELCRQVNIEVCEIDAVVIADTYDEKLEELYPSLVSKAHEDKPLVRWELSANDLPNGPIELPFKKNIEIFWTCHHAAHALSGLYLSGYSDCAVLVVDGYGPCCATMGYVYRDNRLIRVDEMKNRALLGLRYQLFGYFAKEIDSDKTDGLDMAGKVMGLNAYGSIIDEYVKYFKRWFSDADFKKYLDCEKHDDIFFSDLVLGGLSNNSTSVLEKNYLNIVASMQEAFSQIMEELVDELISRTGAKNLVVAGGCGLNVLANTRISKRVQSVYFHPNAGDGGLSIGAASLGSAVLNNEYLHHPRVCNEKRRNPYIGLDLIAEDRLNFDGHPFLKRMELSEKKSSTALYIANLLSNNNIIGIVRGKSEMGPRALGNRSILANASNPNMRDILNHKIKHREWWRPFAPVCRSVDVSEYFVCDCESPYMLTTALVKKEYISSLSSACHEDGTARLQVIPDRQWHPFLWDILSELKKITGIGVLINTSFNDSGKPLVNKSSDAIEMLLNTKMDAIWMNGVLITKRSE
jgi:carbamoyltransferase